MKLKKKSKLIKAFSFILTAASLCMVPYTGVYAAADNDMVPSSISKNNTSENNTSENNSSENNTVSNAAGTVVLNLANNKGQQNLIHSSSFQVSDGQALTLDIKSTIKGTVDLTLFSPSYQVQRITLGGINDTKTINLPEAGTWSYNCTGFFDSGDISIIGTTHMAANNTTENNTSENNTSENNSSENNTVSNVTGTVVLNLANNKGQQNLIHSSSFQVGDGQALTLDIKSTIKGTVDLTLFSPSHQVQRITIGGINDIKTINLPEAGTWSYNCTGFFDSGDISIIGTIK